MGIKYGFRSGLEERVAEQLQSHGIDPKFESLVIPWIEPASKHKYKPDFPVHPRIIIETKGRLLTADRKKHEQVKAQHPELDIRFVFTRSKARISKTSKTTYAEWCEKRGFKYADERIPEEWINEIKTQGA